MDYGLNYMTFEHIFVTRCNGVVVTGLEKPKTTKPDAQYVDWYILLPAIMSEEERIKYLGRDYRNITKDALSDMRRGKIPVRDYITALFAKENAVEIVKSHFLQKVPQAIVGGNRALIVDELWTVIVDDYSIPFDFKEQLNDKRTAALHEAKIDEQSPELNTASTDALCDFLAHAFVFAMFGKQLVRKQLQLSPIVTQVLEDVKREKYTFLYPLLEAMSKAVIQGAPDERNNCILKSATNDSDFSDDDFRTVAYELLPYSELLDKLHASMLYSIRMFAVSLDQAQAIQIGGKWGLDSLYNRYGFSSNDFITVELNPATTSEVEYKGKFSDGTPVRIAVKVKDDGSIDFKVIGEDKNDN